MLAWILVVLVAILAVLVIIKVIQVLFGLLAIALIVIGFFIVRDRLNDWLRRRSSP